MVHEAKRERTDAEKMMKDGGIAQLGEHLLCKQGVRSSILLTSTNRNGRKLRREANSKEFGIASDGRRTK